MPRKRTVRTDKPFYDMIEVHGERAITFKSKNRELLRVFNHMFGYAFITRQFMSALDSATAIEASTPEDLRLQEVKRHQMKVRLSLETTFNNSLYAAVRLLSFGMIREANSLVRTAFEALQYFRLLEFDNTAFEEFDTKPLKAVEVRKRLEACGHDPAPIRQRYGELSRASHLGGPGTLDFSLDELDADVIRIGGYSDEQLQTDLLRDIVLLTHLFQAFGLGISDENALTYFEELRTVLNSGEAPSKEAAAKVIELINTYRFSPKGQ